MDRVLLVATMDTKGQEAAYVQRCLEREDVPVLTLDAGIQGKCPFPVDIDRETIARAGGKDLAEVQGIGHEGKALAVMIAGAVQCARDAYQAGRFKGIIGIGGSMGTTLGTSVMRSFPVGVPKVMISTMASRDTRAFVGTKDICMLHSVCDISGLNRITKRILHNGAMAMAGMIRHPPSPVSTERPVVFISTLGTTEVCAQRVKNALTAEGKEVVVFHTVGAGGKAMEEMVSEEDVAAVVDLSLHEIADHLFGGDYDAGADRGTAALQKGTPTILVPGNIDFLVTGPLPIAQQRFPNRATHSHNAAITTIRTSREELKILAGAFATLCNDAKGPLDVLVPMKGFSAFDSAGGPLYDPEGPEAFVKAFKQGLHNAARLRLLPCHINDPEFSDALVSTLKQLVGEV
jgi:uncharacterized protein (UPF0261 family)